MKKLLSAVLLAAVLAAGQARAGTVTDFANAGSVTVGDKTFAYVSSSANIANTTLSVSNIVPNIWTVTLGDGTSNIFGPGNTGPGSLVYTVTINDPNFFFTRAALDVTFLGGGATVDEAITPNIGSVVHLVSTNGSADISFISGTQLLVNNQINVDALSAIISLQNSFEQAAVPEPGSLAIWATTLVGMVGFGWLKRRGG